MILLSLFIQFSLAQIGSTADGMGGAGIGAPHPYESALLNPAALIESKTQYFALQTHSSENVVSGVDTNQHSLFITDAGDMTIFPGALMYRQRTNKIAGQRIREQQIQLSGAGAITRHFALGLSGYKIRTNLETGADYNQYNADLGAYWFLNEQWSLGAVFRGLLGSKDTAWAASQVLPSTGLGAEYRFFDMFKLRYDVNYFLEQNSDNRFRHQFGGEVRYDFLLVLRAGMSQDDRLAENRWSAGIGWDGPKLKVAYAYQKETRQKLGESHSIDMWLDF